ncbi:DUF1697 domain-containing protein [Pontixanthobacter aestiaquae]|uniref:DUF1697 domain-containing protein n=1 Tax=Pontixanthobacter aestiaquae TaxID=1509367 RepID=A0A844Z9T5_9SPHN|nr:DUF1697 domain-containing protein [Pontixanthobacter aestiaquae]MDN3644719.1 DUF1697 domain-containing protein [Pontixanthobacter aestiaquae]MXO84274.1 DUF1697 domain-containing protein [Pontixanthobacter aestiaquae]
MNRYVAFLGSINVGKDRLKMVDLREALEREELEEIETVAASGNVLFTHEPMPSEGLAEKIAWIIRDEFDIDSEVVVMTRDELAAIIAENPFAQGPEAGEEKFVHTMFFLDQPGDMQIKALQIDHEGRGNERIAGGTNALHVDYVDGVGRSKLTGDFITRRLGIRGTARNIRSMKRILAKMDELNG